VRPVAERKRIAITVKPIPGELQLSGDRELMEYACYNLLTNAVKYSGGNTDIEVSVVVRGNGAVGLSASSLRRRGSRVRRRSAPMVTS